MRANFKLKIKQHIFLSVPDFYSAFFFYLRYPRILIPEASETIVTKGGRRTERLLQTEKLKERPQQGGGFGGRGQQQQQVVLRKCRQRQIRESSSSFGTAEEFAARRSGRTVLCRFDRKCSDRLRGPLHPKDGGLGI